MARPLWTPGSGPATALDEALHLSATPLALGLFIATALVVRFRSQWGGVGVTVGWSFYVYFVTFTDDVTLLDAMRAEGCAASPGLFIGLVTAICAATILYTAPREGGSTDKET